MALRLHVTRFRRVLPLIFALIMGLASVAIMREVIVKERRALAIERKKLYAEYQAPVEVIVAATDIPQDATLEPAHLKKAAVPERFAQPYAVGSPAELLGKVALAPIAEGEQVLLNKVRSADAVPATATLSSLTPKGKRAVTIGVDAITGVGGFVRPGDAVDVLWTIQIPAATPGQSEQGQLVTVTLFQEVPVLAVGREIVGRSTQTSEASNQYTVTLALTPQETSFLLFAREQGRIQLSLRSNEEKGPVAVVPANITALMQAMFGDVAAAPEPKPRREVEVYKGLERDVVLLPDDS